MNKMDSARNRDSSPDSSAGSERSRVGQNACALRPPPYGISLVDSEEFAGATSVNPNRQPAASAAVHAAAKKGISGAGGPLPHLDAIQKSFGKHDVSHIQAHTDGAAAAGARAMGAEAFATGNHVAFGGAPSLHTAAHEAAHVVQQRGGVQLKGGVGEVGDTHERHADAVADRVARGESAEALLDERAGSKMAADARAGSDAIQQVRSKINAPAQNAITYAAVAQLWANIQEQLNEVEDGEFINEENVNRWRGQATAMMQALQEQCEHDETSYTWDEIQARQTREQQRFHAALIPLSNLRGELNTAHANFAELKSARQELENNQSKGKAKGADTKKEKKVEKTTTKQGPIGLGTKWGPYREKLKWKGQVRFVQHVPPDAPSIEACMKSQDLLDAVHHDGKAFWVADPAQFKLSSSAGKTMMIYTFTPDGARSLMEDYLLCSSGDFAEHNEEEWSGETAHPDYTLWKTSEIGAYGIGSTRLKQLASTCIKIEKK